jgi:hypothetical protein
MIQWKRTQQKIDLLLVMELGFQDAGHQNGGCQ